MTADLEESILGPGDSVGLEVFFATKRYLGKITKRPRIETNARPPNHWVTIISYATERLDSTYPIIIRPYKLDISQFGETIRDRMTFSLMNVSDQDIRLRQIDGFSDLFFIKLPKGIRAHSTWTGELVLRPKAFELSFEKSITITLLDDSRARFTIPIKRAIRAPER